MDTSLEWKIVVGQRRFTRRRRGRPQQSWKNQVMDFMRSRNMEEDMAEDRHLRRLGVNGRILAVQLLIKKKPFSFSCIPFYCGFVGCLIWNNFITMRISKLSILAIRLIYFSTIISLISLRDHVAQILASNTCKITNMYFLKI